MSLVTVFLTPCRMSLRPKKGRVAMSILGVHAPNRSFNCPIILMKYLNHFIQCYTTEPNNIVSQYHIHSTFHIQTELPITVMGKPCTLRSTVLHYTQVHGEAPSAHAQQKQANQKVGLLQAEQAGQKRTKFNGGISIFTWKGRETGSA